MSYSVGEVAKLAKVSIRTLHHYDAIGLLVPSERNEAGYRYYSSADLQKLQLIRLYRALEFPLNEIGEILTGDDYDREAILLQQRELLRARAGELADALALIDTTLNDLRGPAEHLMSSNALFDVFPDLDEELQAEAEKRWGVTDSWRQSAERSKRYSKADLQRFKDAMAHTAAEAERVFTSGAAADSAAGIACAETARLLINQWFYDCSRDFHANLTAMTSKDPRFVANIDTNCPGLAAWLHRASVANLQQA